MPPVFGQKNEIVAQCGGGDPEVVVAHGKTFASQLIKENGGSPQRFDVQRVDEKADTKPIPRRDIIKTACEFALRDYAHCQLFVGRLGKQAGGRTVLTPFSLPIKIDEEGRIAKV